MKGIWAAVKATTRNSGRSRKKTWKSWKSRPAAPRTMQRKGMATSPVGKDDGSGLAAQRRRQRGRIAHHGAPAGPGGEAEAGFDLRRHAARLEVPLLEQGPRPRRAQAAQRRLPRGAEVGVGAGDVGDEQEQPGRHLVGEERGGEVLVHHRLR